MTSSTTLTTTRWTKYSSCVPSFFASSAWCFNPISFTPLTSILTGTFIIHKQNTCSWWYFTLALFLYIRFFFVFFFVLMIFWPFLIIFLYIRSFFCVFSILSFDSQILHSNTTGFEILNVDNAAFYTCVLIFAGFVLFGSLLYYALVFFTEIWGMTPKWVKKCCASKKGRRKCIQINLYSTFKDIYCVSFL